MNANAQTIDPVPADTLPANYQWWQENGGEWISYYKTIKEKGPKYYIEEFILCEYMAQHAPAKVLEFGCGTGRHLQYLHTIPGIDIYGHDQSPTMLAGVRQWAEPQWFEKHIHLGPPLQKLPYEDNSFDIVYTAKVLLHVRPKDIPSILAEIIRVSRGHVVHLENRVGWMAPYQPDHDGCWIHDLPAAYKTLGWECEDLTCSTPTTPAVFRALAPETATKYTPSAALLSHYALMVRTLMGADAAK